ncbi:MAG: outer membrane protein assembly factor BamA [Bacteriovoracaceae bacterium]
MVEVDTTNLKIKKGVTLDSAQLLEDAETLKKENPQFAEVVPRVEPLREKELVQVFFELQRRWKIGLVRIDIGELDELPLNLRDRLSTIKGAIFKARNIERDKKMLREEFIKMGYPMVQVDEMMTESRRSKTIDVTYKVQFNSKRILINDVRFHGNKSFRSSELIDVMKTRARTFFLANRPTFKLFDLDEDMKKLEAHYQDNGYLLAKATYTYKIKNARYIEIDVKIEEGDQTIVKGIAFSGNDQFSDQELAKIFKFAEKPGYSDKSIRVGLQAIREAYGERGYSLVETMASFDNTEGIIYVALRENLPQYINQIKLEGTFKMKPETILLDVTLKEGQLINTKEIEKTLKKLKDTGHYSDVQIDYNPINETQGDLIIMLAQGGSQMIRFGAGMGPESGLAGELVYSNNNLFNTGKRINFSAMKSIEMTKLGLMYQDPHFFNTDLQMTSTATGTATNHADYDEYRAKLQAMIEKKISDHITAGIGVRLEYVSYDDLSDLMTREDYDASGSGVVVGMIGTLMYSTAALDEANDVKDGVKIRVAMLPSLADDEAYMKMFSSMMVAHSLATNAYGVSHTIKGRLTLGHATAKAPFYERFNAGGPGTLRGYKEGSLKGPSGQNPNTVLSTNVEYAFPLWKNRLKGVVFLEAATFGDRTGFSDIRAVGGMGLRANMASTFLNGVLEAGVAIPFKKHDGDATKPFYFIFGDYDPAYDL